MNNLPSHNKYPSNVQSPTNNHDLNGNVRRFDNATGGQISGTPFNQMENFPMQTRPQQDKGLLKPEKPKNAMYMSSMEFSKNNNSQSSGFNGQYQPMNGFGSQNQNTNLQVPNR